jgi:hypothetical protein
MENRRNILSYYLGLRAQPRHLDYIFTIARLLSRHTRDNHVEVKGVDSAHMAFDLAKIVAGLRKARYRGLPKIGWRLTVVMAAESLVRLRQRHGCRPDSGRRQLPLPARHRPHRR